MSSYTQITDFSAKDALTTGDPEKVISGADVDAELAAIATAIATKFDTSNDGAGSGLDADSVDGVGPVASGTYSPTLTGETNVDSVSAPANWHYFRLGTIVTVSGQVTLDPTAAAATAFRATLPVASNIGAVTDVSGLGRDSQCTYAVLGDATNDAASFSCIPTSGASRTGYIMFTYKII